MSEIQRYLAAHPLFLKINDSLMTDLSRACAARHVEKGEIIYFQSDPSESVYLVRSGGVSIVLNSLDGRDLVIDDMQGGDLFGELGVMTRGMRATSAVARVKSDLLVIPGRTFLDLIQKEHTFTLRILDLSVRRLEMSRKRESALAFLDAQSRLARLLLALEAQEADKGYVTISQDELAHHTGMIRQTVAKVLGKWRRSGWLITGRGRILILNRKALENLEKSLMI